MMNRILVLAMLMVGNCCAVLSQTQILKTLNRDQYLAKVKLVDEFFARFNGQETRQDISNKYKDRASSIMLLFDLAKFKSKSDSGFVAAEQFAKDVVSDSIYINYEDGKWFAKAKCTGVLSQKSVNFYLYLTVEEVRDSVYKWVIANVDGDIFKTMRDKPHEELFISPNSHELFFSSLRNITKDSYEFIDDYAKKTFKANQLSVFMTLVRCGKLKINAVSDLEFVFTQVPNYIFTIRHFERESRNAGWLIGKLEKITEKDKFIKEILQ